MNYDLVKQLLEQVEAFERQLPASGPPTLADFAAWLPQQVAPTQPDEQATAGPIRSGGLVGNPPSPEAEIGITITYLYRYTRLYSKKALADTPLSTIDEFSYMVILLLEGPAPTKTELIDRNVHEKTTGTEILRRLINGGLIEQFDDLTDRRAKRLKLTDKGRALMFQVMPRMSEVVMLMGGNLTTSEKMDLFHLVSKLHLFHNQIFLHERDTDLHTLIGRLDEEKI